jgi:PBP1b-binding outer membrane lipoprotein LpoB
MRSIGRLLIFAIAASFLAGCTGGSEASVSANEEANFKNPPPVDRSKIPANPFETKGPAFIGEPSGATNPSGGTPPPAATGK